MIFTEVLQDFVSDREFNTAKTLMASLTTRDLAGHIVAVHAAANYRTLRALSVTVRKTIDTLIATHCIENDLPLLYSDRDFVPFVQHLGLRSAME